MLLVLELRGPLLAVELMLPGVLLPLELTLFVVLLALELTRGVLLLLAFLLDCLALERKILSSSSYLCHPPLREEEATAWLKLSDSDGFSECSKTIKDGRRGILDVDCSGDL